MNNNIENIYMRAKVTVTWHNVENIDLNLYATTNNAQNFNFFFHFYDFKNRK